MCCGAPIAPEILGQLPCCVVVRALYSYSVLKADFHKMWHESMLVAQPWRLQGQLQVFLPERGLGDQKIYVWGLPLVLRGESHC